MPLAAQSYSVVAIYESRRRTWKDAISHQNQIVRIQAVNAGLMIVLSVVLVERFGIMGAATASAIAVAVTNLWSLTAVYRRMKLFPYNFSYLKLLFP